ncbi:MAG: VanZ family protein [Ginsengibacter sp.]
MYKISFKKFIPGIAWFFIVLILMCLPGKDLPPTDWLHINSLDKWLHITVFGFLVFLFCWPFYKSVFSESQRKYYFIKIALAVSLWGLTLEFVQKYFIPGRSFDLVDWAADSIGALITYFICRRIFAKPCKNAKLGL